MKLFGKSENQRRAEQIRQDAIQKFGQIKKTTYENVMTEGNAWLTLVNPLREAIRLDPKEPTQHKTLGWVLWFIVNTKMQEHMGDKDRIAVIELPENIRTEIRLLRNEGRECFERYQKLGGKITDEEQRLIKLHF